MKDLKMIIKSIVINQQNKKLKWVNKKEITPIYNRN